MVQKRNVHWDSTLEGRKGQAGSRKWVSFLSFLKCFSSSCDPDALRARGYGTGAECAEGNLPLRAVAWLSGNHPDKDQVGVIHSVPDTSNCLDLHTLGM